MGATTLLQAVNKCLRRGRLIQGDDAELTSLTNHQYQNDVTLMVTAWNDVVRYMYSLADPDDPLPQECKEGSITLVSGTREYSVPADYVSMAGDRMVEQTEGYFIDRFEGGYKELFRLQLQPSSYTGRPLFWVINPNNGKFYMDFVPQADDDGLVYKFLYNQTLEYTDATDTFPFNDEVLLELVPAVTETWQRETKERFDDALFNLSLSNAIKKLRQVPIRDNY